MHSAGKVCRKPGKSLQQTREVWVTKPFTNWKKAVEKMKAHEKFKVIFTPKLFWRFWLQMGHCEKAQSCTEQLNAESKHTREDQKQSRNEVSHSA